MGSISGILPILNILWRLCQCVPFIGRNIIFIFLSRSLIGCFKTAASQPRLEIDFLANCRPPPTPPTLPKAEAGTSLRQLLPAMISKTNKVLGLGEGGEVCANNFPCTITTTASKQGQLCSPDNSDHRASDLNVPLLMSTVEKNLFGGNLFHHIFMWPLLFTYLWSKHNWQNDLPRQSGPGSSVGRALGF